MKSHHDVQGGEAEKRNIPVKLQGGAVLIKWIGTSRRGSPQMDCMVVGRGQKNPLLLAAANDDWKQKRVKI